MVICILLAKSLIHIGLEIHVGDCHVKFRGLIVSIYLDSGLTFDIRSLVLHHVPRTVLLTRISQMQLIHFWHPAALHMGEEITNAHTASWENHSETVFECVGGTGVPQWNLSAYARCMYCILKSKISKFHSVKAPRCITRSPNSQTVNMDKCK